MAQASVYRHDCPDVDCPSRRTPRREDFVEKKLRWMFGLRDIEFWITRQKHADVPDLEGWGTLIIQPLPCADGFDPVDLLRRFGKRVEPAAWADLDMPLRPMDPARIQAYEHPGFRFMFEVGSPVAFLVEGLSICDYHPDDAQHRRRLLQATLLRAWSDRQVDAELADQARGLLCAPYVKAVEAEAHRLREDYDGSTVIGAIFTGKFEFHAGPIKLEHVIVWSKDKDGFTAVLCPGAAFCPDSFGDHGLEQHPRVGVTLDEAFHGFEGGRFRRRRKLLEPLEFVSRGNIPLCIFAFEGGQVLFVRRDCLKHDPPPGEKLL